MKPLILQYTHHESSADMIKCFEQGIPLSSDQWHHLDWHKQVFNSPIGDAMQRYYIESLKRKKESMRSFALPSDEFNAKTVQQFKERMKVLLKQKGTKAIFRFNHKQYLDFKKYTMGELIFWHGNHLLTGAPFIPGGIPNVVLFQWGNFFGIVKYVVLLEEKAIKGNLLVYFEDMQDRDLNQCVLDYDRKIQYDLQYQNNLLLEHKIESMETKFIVKPSTMLKPSYN
jgi:hypothetical protein